MLIAKDEEGMVSLITGLKSGNGNKIDMKNSKWKVEKRLEEENV